VKALVLAAGRGTRLFPLTLFRAKPAFPFLGRPIIQYSLNTLRKAGVEEVIINLHHLPDTVRQAVKPFSGVRFSYETEILGTGGAIGKVRDYLADDDFVVCNGKIYFEDDLRKAFEFHKASGALVTLVLVPFHQHPHFNPVFVDAKSNIRGFGPGYQADPNDKPYVFTGVHVLSPQVLSYIPEGASDSVRDIYVPLIREGKAVKGFISQSYWCEISTPRRYLEKSFEVLKRHNRNVSIVAGERSTLHPTATVHRSIIWDNVRVGERAYLNNVIVADNITIPDSARFENAIITPPVDFDESRGYRREADFVVWQL